MNNPNRRADDHRPAMPLRWGERWTLLLTGQNSGVVGPYGATWPGESAEYERVNVCVEGADQQAAPEAPTLPECVTAWVRAEQAVRTASEAHNKAFAENAKEPWPGRDLNPEFQVLEEAKNKAHHAKLAMFDALTATAPATQQAGAAERAKELVEQYRTGYRHGYEEGRAELPAATTASASIDEEMQLMLDADKAHGGELQLVPQSMLWLALQGWNLARRAPAPSQEAAPLDEIAGLIRQALPLTTNIEQRDFLARALALAQQGAAQAAHAGTDTERDAARYRYIATLQDWGDVERMCWSTPAKNAEELKRGLDSFIDGKLETLSPDHAECIERIAATHAADARDLARYRWLCYNNFDRQGSTQVHTWVHTWEPHSQTGEPTEWKVRVRGSALDRAIDAAIAASAKGAPEAWQRDALHPGYSAPAQPKPDGSE